MRMRETTCCKTPPTDTSLMEFPNPKLKRKRVSGRLRALIKEERIPKNGQKCRGILMGSSVMVYGGSDVTFLTSLGFYGRGIFSRNILASSDSRQSRKRRRDVVKKDKEQGREQKEEEEREEEERNKRTRVEPRGEVRQQLISTQSGTVTEPLQTECRPDVQSVMVESESTADPEFEAGVESVVQESEPSTADETGDKGMKIAPETAIKIPNPLTEPLCLSSEEAFYLAAEKNMLSVSLPSPRSPSCSLPLDDLWSNLCQESNRFPAIYFTYRYYRRKGWVPKTGLKYGVDFLLYKEGPESYHSSYAVLVFEDETRNLGQISDAPGNSNIGDPNAARNSEILNLDGAVNPEEHEEVNPSDCSLENPSEGGLQNLDEADDSSSKCKGQRLSCKPLLWMDIIAQCRVCESTAKELVIARVTTPPHGDSVTPNLSLQLLEHMSISETLVTRWIPDKDR